MQKRRAPRAASGLWLACFGAALDPQNQRPDVIVLDINLPSSEILRYIPERSLYCGVDSLVSTSGSEKDRQDVINRGANGYFRKPFEYDEYLKLGSNHPRFSTRQPHS